MNKDIALGHVIEFFSFQTSSGSLQKGTLKSTLNWCNGPLKYLDPPGPKTALASHPGSGNTWARYLIQHVSGYFTGSVYKDDSLKNSDFPAEGVSNGEVIVIKTHQRSMNIDMIW